MPGKGDINPATGKAYAVNPSTGAWDDNYWANTVEPMLKAQYGGGNLDPTGQYIQNAITKLDDQYFSKIKDFDTKNPFVYDDVLKQEMTKAGTRLDPYYMQQLNDYTRGIDLQKSRSVEDMRTTLSTLNADLDSYTKENRQSLDTALEKSRQGYADVGNYFSGAQAKGTAKTGLDSNEQLNQYTQGNERSQQSAQLANKRNIEDYGLKQKMFERGVGSYDPVTGAFKRGAESEAQVRGQAIPEVGVAQQKRQFALGQYAGPPPGADQNAYYLNLYSGLQ